MTAAEREPMVPLDCDLRGLPWMPLETVRLLDSDMFATSTGEEFKAAMALWCKAWQQVPAASLPNDDRVLAHLSGAGARWPKIKVQALHGFVRCADGRLYHPVLAEKALEAWAHRQAQRARAAKRWHPHQDATAMPRHSSGTAAADATAMQGTGTIQGRTSNPLSGGAPDAVCGPDPQGSKAARQREARAAGARAIEYLNEKAGTRFRSTEANLKLPTARLLYDNATEADLRAVVDQQVGEAARGEFDRKYLRPATLFNAEKFSQYLGQVGAAAPAIAAAVPKATVDLINADGKRWRFDEITVTGELDFETTARSVLARANGYLSNKRVRTVIVAHAGDVRPFSVEELQRAH